MTTMTLPYIKVDPASAREKLLQYRAALKEAGPAALRAGDLLLKQAFYHASHGRPIISLTEAMVQGGLEEFSYRIGSAPDPAAALRPKLAVAPATAKTCHLFLDDQTVVFVADRSYTAGRRPERGRQHVQTNTVSDSGHSVQVKWDRRTTSYPTDTWYGPPDLQALVPTIPPEHRPKGRSQKAGARLDGYFILWEAEWAVGSPRPPYDPALLKHIGGDLFVVRATWDLTELERMVLAHGAR